LKTKCADPYKRLKNVFETFKKRLHLKHFKNVSQSERFAKPIFYLNVGKSNVG